MASTASAKSHPLHNFTLPFDLKWSTTTKNKNGNGGHNNGRNEDGVKSNNDNGTKSQNATVRIRSKHLRSKKFSGVVGDSSSKKPLVFESDEVVVRKNKEGSESEKKSSKIQVFERATKNKPNVSSSSSDHPIKKTIIDRLIEKSEKKVNAAVPVEKGKKVVSHGEKLEKKAKVADRSINKNENKINSPDRLIEIMEKKMNLSDRLIQKSVKRPFDPDRLSEMMLKKAAVSVKSEKTVTFPEKSEEKVAAASDLRSKLLFRVKGKSKAEDTLVEDGIETGGEESEDLMAKTWNLRPRKLVTKKKPNANNGGGGTPKSGGALPQEIKKPPQNKAKKNETTRVRTHADAEIAQSNTNKMGFSISLTKEEVEEDIFVMTGSKPSRRPKKRAKHAQKQFDNLFPGVFLSTVTPDSYKVSENLPKS